MSTFKVCLTTIRAIEPHTNADKLEFAKVYDFNVVVQKGRYKVGDAVFYVPIDSVLSEHLEGILFPPDSKVKLQNRRVRQIRIRGQYSQGMLINPSDVIKPQEGNKLGEQEEDFAQILGITKYEEPVKAVFIGQKKKIKITVNENFKEFTDIQNIKYYDRTLEAYPTVVATTKLHGTSWRASYAPIEPNTLWRKVLRFFGKTHELCWGSRRSQLQHKLIYTGYYKEDVYTKVYKKYAIADILKPGESIYGEVVGPGIQGEYSYGVPEGDYELYVYDVMKDGKYLDYDDMLEYCLQAGLKTVPEQYRGPYIKSEIAKFLNINPIGTEVNEGLVIKPTTETFSNSLGRVILKWVSERYYENQDKINGTEFH